MEGKRRRKGRRSLLDRRKNAERRLKQANSAEVLNVPVVEQVPVPPAMHSSPPPSTASLISFLGVAAPRSTDSSSSSSFMHSNLPCSAANPSTGSVPPSQADLPPLSSSSICTPSENTICLPDDHWQMIGYDCETQYCRIEKSSSGASKVTSSVIIYTDKSWDVYINESKVPATSPVLARFPQHMSHLQVSELLHAVHTAWRCPGNPEEKFVNLCTKKGGEMRGERGHGDVISHIDNTVVVDDQGRSYSCTVRRFDCDIGRCKACSSYRDTLRSTLSRQQRSGDHISTSSHTPYFNLTPSEKDMRLRNLHNSLKDANKEIATLEEKIRRISKEQALDLQVRTFPPVENYRPQAICQNGCAECHTFQCPDCRAGSNRWGATSHTHMHVGVIEVLYCIATFSESQLKVKRGRDHPPLDLALHLHPFLFQTSYIQK